jgi:RNA polymerase sigma-70 factor (ECF subfamily)
MHHAFSDMELSQRLSQGDEKAFGELYNRFWEKLFAIACNRLQDITLAEDVVHDVFESLWNNRNNIQIHALENYLATATKYMALAQVRKKAYSDRYIEQNKFLHPAESTIENAIHYRRILEMVESEINTLPEKCRIIFKYSREGQMSSKEIAETLGISPKTVDNQIHKALHHLKLKLKHLYSSFLSLL